MDDMLDVKKFMVIHKPEKTKEDIQEINEILKRNEGRVIYYDQSIEKVKIIEAKTYSYEELYYSQACGDCTKQNSPCRTINCKFNWFNGSDAIIG